MVIDGRPTALRGLTGQSPRGCIQGRRVQISARIFQAVPLGRPVKGAEELYRVKLVGSFT